MKCKHVNSNNLSTVLTYRGIQLCLHCHKRGYRSNWRVLHIDGIEGVL
jgi:hypothetical protein